MTTPWDRWRLAFAEAKYERLHTWGVVALEELKQLGRVTDVTMAGLSGAMAPDHATLPLPPQEVHEGDAAAADVWCAADGLIAFYEARNAADRAAGRPLGFSEQVSSVCKYLAGPLDWRARVRWAASLTASLADQGGHPDWTSRYIAAVRPLVVALLAKGPEGAGRV